MHKFRFRGLQLVKLCVGSQVAYLALKFRQAKFNRSKIPHRSKIWIPLDCRGGCYFIVITLVINLPCQFSKEKVKTLLNSRSWVFYCWFWNIKFKSNKLYKICNFKKLPVEVRTWQLDCHSICCQLLLSSENPNRLVSIILSKNYKNKILIYLNKWNIVRIIA